MPYIGRGSDFGVRSRFIYTATAGQTTFSGNDDAGITLAYTDTLYMDVYQNGVLLVPATDYAASTGTSVVLVQGASVDDTLELLVHDIFSVADSVSAKDGGTFSGTIAAAGLSTSSLGTSNFRAGVNAGNSIEAGGNYNTVVGDEAGTAITTGDYNTAVGKSAGAAVTTGAKNTIIGGLAGDAITTGDNNTAVGYQSLSATTTASQNTAVGLNSLKDNTTGASNVAVGQAALSSNTTAASNTAVGYAALSVNTSGANNVAVGALALDANTTGADNTAIGYDALTGNTTASNNTAVGKHAMGVNTSGTFNVAVGNYALDANTTANNNTAVGYAALSANTTGASNTAVGQAALQDNTTGGSNTAIGSARSGSHLGTLENNTTGTNNTGAGAGVLANTTTGSSNTGVGFLAMYDVTTGDNNIGLGNAAGRSSSPGGAITTASNTITLGNNNIATANIKVDWTVSSDQRDKTDFTALDIGLDFVKELKPVTYKWDERSNYGDKDADDWSLLDQTPDGTHKKDWLDVGFKAQDVEALEKAAGYNKSNKTNLTVSLSADGEQYGIKYSKFVPILVKALQELSEKNDALEARITALEA